MEIFTLISVIILIYLLNMLICTFYHIINATRSPRNIWDFIKLTFLPYVIFKKYLKTEEYQKECWDGIVNKIMHLEQQLQEKDKVIEKLQKKLNGCVYRRDIAERNCEHYREIVNDYVDKEEVK